MEFDIDKFLTEKLGVTPMGAVGAYLGASTGSSIGLLAGTMIGNAVNEPLGNLFLQLWDCMIGYRVKFLADKTKYDYEQKLQDYKNGKIANKPKIEFVMRSPSFVHALNLNILRNKILSKIMDISPEKKKEPELALIGPLLKDAEYYADSEIIRELYANLVAASANKEYDSKVHLAFASIIKQISPHDAVLLTRLPQQGPLASYFMMPGFEILYEDVYLEDENDEYDFANTLSIQNFERLGFLELGRRMKLCGNDLYKRFGKNKIYQEGERKAQAIYGKSGSITLQSGYFIFTKFGQVFREVCRLSVKLTK